MQSTDIWCCRSLHIDLALKSSCQKFFQKEFISNGSKQIYFTTRQACHNHWEPVPQPWSSPSPGSKHSKDGRYEPRLSPFPFHLAQSEIQVSGWTCQDAIFLPGWLFFYIQSNSKCSVGCSFNWMLPSHTSSLILARNAFASFPLTSQSKVATTLKIFHPPLIHVSQFTSSPPTPTKGMMSAVMGWELAKSFVTCNQRYSGQSSHCEWNWEWINSVWTCIAIII